MNLRKGREIRDNVKLRESFFYLGNITFGLEYSDWSNFGYWDDTYVPYSIEMNGEIVSNISVSISTLVIDGGTYKAAQIGGVMTAQNYRGQGLSKKLMETVLADLVDVDFIYLFANKRVLRFYPKFGFEIRKQSTYRVQSENLHYHPAEVKKLDLQDESTRDFFLDFITHRLPVSTKLGIIQHESIIMFHALNAYRHCIYYISTLNVIVIAEQKENQLHVYDIISKRYVSLRKVLSALPVQVDSMELYFTPSDPSLAVEKELLKEGSTMFVKVQGNTDYPNDVRFPITSYT